MTRAILPPLLLCWGLLLSACEATAPAREVRLVRPPLPPSLLEPISRPALPPRGALLTQGAIAELLIEQDATIEGYEARLAEIRRIEAAAQEAAR